MLIKPLPPLHVGHVQHAKWRLLIINHEHCALFAFVRPSRCLLSPVRRYDAISSSSESKGPTGQPGHGSLMLIPEHPPPQSDTRKHVQTHIHAHTCVHLHTYMHTHDYKKREGGEGEGGRATTDMEVYGIVASLVYSLKTYHSSSD